MPDVKYAGGLSALMHIAEMSQRHGTSVSIHNPSGPIGHLVSVHVMYALETDELLEYQYDETELFDEIAKGEIPPRHGCTTVPVVPGIGVGL
jgi:L-alanine-DL-glutamate epimerase-like enolase superfamily enzyme